MILRLPYEPLFILYTLQHHGFEAYIVGGAVRDVVRASWGSEMPDAVDFDFTTNALPEQIQSLFPEHFYENTFGTVSVTQAHLRQQMGIRPEDELAAVADEPPSTGENTVRKPVIDLGSATKLHASLSSSLTGHPLQLSEDIPAYQITTFRSDEVYADFRRPTSMNWGTTLKEDLERRDFTMNAMAIQINQSLLAAIFSKPIPHISAEHEIVPDTYTLIDYHQGLSDLKAELLKAVGDPQTRFREDALRMLRAVRFSVQLNVAIDETTFEAITAQAELIKNISAERIRDEFMKMLGSNYPAEAIDVLDATGLLTYVLPELLVAKGVQQAGHHTTDVWTHSLDALRTCPSKDPVVRLATLLHDIAKPQTQQITETTITFYNHEVIGARTAKRIAERLRLSRRDCERIFSLVRFHMFYYQPENTDASIRRFMRKVGLENINDILDLREGDRLGSGARHTSWRLEEMKQRMVEQLHQPLSVHDLAVNGTDVMESFELKPGPILGKVLNQLFELILEKPELNTKEALLSEAKRILAQD